MRESGILLHITSLPSRGGIGTLGKEAFAFIDFLHDAGMQVWQVLPVGPTGYGESPYQSASTYAGNPMLIDLTALQAQGLLDSADFPTLPDDALVDFETVRAQKDALLRKAFSRVQDFSATQAFAQSHAWAADYALFMALKTHFGGVSWQSWPQEIRLRNKAALDTLRQELQQEIDYHLFVQQLFFAQWADMRAYAAKQGVKLFGDMPIYVAEDSADAWANPEIFQMDADKRPIKVAGVPPDYFSADGQLWGNPLYDWKALRRRRYDWWIARLNAMGELFDYLRVDHFIGFANYYAIPAGAKNARVGEWIKGPGRKLFRRVRREVRGVRIIAEDLGAVNGRVRRLLRYCGYPGMKIITFAFDGGDDNVNLPQHHTKNCVAYTGTHDNNTALGWWQQDASPEAKAKAARMLGLRAGDDPVGKMIALAFASPAEMAIIPMQDFLRLDQSARMNMPGTVGGLNWRWRMTQRPPEAVKEEILRLNQEYHRGRNQA